MWERLALSDAEIARGLDMELLVSDTRLRDVLRALRNGIGPERPVPRRAERDAYALEAVVFEGAEVVRLQRWIDDLERRFAPLEDTVSRWTPRLSRR